MAYGAVYSGGTNAFAEGTSHPPAGIGTSVEMRIGCAGSKLGCGRTAPIEGGAQIAKMRLRRDLILGTDIAWRFD